MNVEKGRQLFFGGEEEEGGRKGGKEKGQKKIYINIR